MREIDHDWGEVAVATKPRKSWAVFSLALLTMLIIGTSLISVRNEMIGVLVTDGVTSFDAAYMQPDGFDPFEVTHVRLGETLTEVALVGSVDVDTGVQLLSFLTPGGAEWAQAEGRERGAEVRLVAGEQTLLTSLIGSWL